jgi:hypothetical protein
MRNTELSTLSSESEPPPIYLHPHEKYDERFWRPKKAEFKIIGLRNPQIHFFWVQNAIK